jgi:hypothetical protein
VKDFDEEENGGNIAAVENDPLAIMRASINIPLIQNFASGKIRDILTAIESKANNIDACDNEEPDPINAGF